MESAWGVVAPYSSRGRMRRLFLHFGSHAPLSPVSHLQHSPPLPPSSITPIYLYYLFYFPCSLPSFMSAFLRLSYISSSRLFCSPPQFLPYICISRSTSHVPYFPPGNSFLPLVPPVSPFPFSPFILFLSLSYLYSLFNASPLSHHCSHYVFSLIRIFFLFFFLIYFPSP